MSESRANRIYRFKSLFQQNHIESLYQKSDELWRKKQYTESIKICNQILSLQYI